MPVDKLSFNVDQSALDPNQNQATKNAVVSHSDIHKFQSALKSFNIPSNADMDMNINDVNVAAAAAESMGVGESKASKKKKSLIEKLSEEIDVGISSGSEQLQHLYKHISSFSSAGELAHGPTMLSLQLELMRATVLIDIITKITNKAATTVDSMIRLQ